MLAPFLALATCTPLPHAPLAIDDLVPRSALDGWCVVMEVLDRFRSAPYGLRIEGAHALQRPAWVGEPLAQPADLPPLPIGVHAIEVLQLKILSGGSGPGATCSAALELALSADDTLGAALLLEHLLARFEALPGVSLSGRPGTVPLAQEAGLRVSALRLDIDLSRFAPQRAAAQERFVSTAVAVRAIGMREGSRVRAVRFSPGSVAIQDGPQRRVFRLTPARPVEAPRATELFHLLARLEATDPELWSTRIDLGPSGTPSASDASQESGPQVAGSHGWSWNVELMSRRPIRVHPAPRLPSALDALAVLRGVLAGFRADPYGVSVTGFFADRSRAGAAQRPPALQASDLRLLTTAGGQRIEVRALSVDHKARTGQANVEVSVDLCCTSERGVVEATRLFEFFAESLRSQPEVVSMNQPRVAELADGTGVFVSGLRIALRVPVRPGTEGREGERPVTNPLTHIRSTAALDGIEVGSLRIDTNTRERSDGTFTEYLLRPLDKQASFGVRQVLDLLWTLEREEPGYTLSSFRVTPPGRVRAEDPLPGRWVFQATLCTTHGR